MTNNKLELRKLDINDLDNLIALQNKIISGFHPDEQHFILHRTREDFAKALHSATAHVFGLFDGNKLVSQSILSLPADDQKRELPEYASNYKNSEIAVFKAVLVDKDYRGQGLMKRMLKTREEVARFHGRKIAITQIAADNPASWVNALQYGMQITKVGYDPEDGAKVIYLQKTLYQSESLNIDIDKSQKLALGSDVHANVPILFNKMQKMSQCGLIGTAWDKERNAILWHPLKEEKQQSKIQINQVISKRAYGF